MKRRGFTLVELLVVIGIIAVLISILLPSLSKAWDSASRVACMSNMWQIYLGFVMYANDNRQWTVGSDTTQYYDYTHFNPGHDNWPWAGSGERLAICSFFRQPEITHRFY